MTGDAVNAMSGESAGGFAQVDFEIELNTQCYGAPYLARSFRASKSLPCDTNSTGKE